MSKPSDRSPPPPVEPAPTLQGAVPFQALAALRESEGLCGSLLVIEGAVADVGSHRVVKDTVVFGRDPGQMLLRDPEVSRRHAQVEHKNGLYVVSDLGSTNGTALNGEELRQEEFLRNGDKISFGRTVIKFTLVDPSEAAVLERMSALASTDPLTGLMAKHRFDAMLSEAFDTAKTEERPLSVLMLDMDGLKAINDKNGHQVGAHTIAEVGRLIGRVVGLHGEACRFGGDEFSVLLPGSPLAVGKRVGERIRQAVEESVFRKGEAEVNPTISIGVADVTEAMTSVRELVSAADVALYRAKDKGRNTVSD
jgi:two-component system, cell cycle response regulator